MHKPHSALDSFVHAFLLLLILMCLAASVTAQGVNFGTAKSYQAGNGPRAVVAGDFNGDGRVDLAVTNQNGNDVSVLKGRGDGTFETPVNFAVGTKPFFLATADFNRDDHLDIATINNGSDNVSLLLGNGDVTFKPAVNYPVGKSPQTIIAYDFNRDGSPDLAVGAGSSVGILFGDGKGGFQNAVSYTVAQGVRDIALGDLNRDGTPDIITANGGSGSDVSVLLGNGDGTFQKALNSSNTNSGVESLIVGDFNRDGRLDVALATQIEPVAKVLPGNGDGTFGAPTFSTRLENTPTDVEMGDFDGDGRMDLVSTGVFKGSNVQILLGKGDGSFQSAGALMDSVGALSAAVADFNGDTRPDIAAIVDSLVSVVLINATPGKPENAQFFVHQHYLDFLDREPDEQGEDYWAGGIDKCLTDAGCIRERRIGTSAAFFVATEFQQGGYFVYRLYRAALGRKPNYAEFTLDRHKVVGGPELERSKAALARAFAQRDAFRQSYPDALSNADFVNKLYDTAGLQPFADERAAAIASLNNGADRASVLLGLIENETFKQREYNPAFVLMQYFGYLRRDIDVEGYDFWLKIMNQQPNNYARMVCAFITSEEYQKRFSSTVTRTNSECGP